MTIETAVRLIIMVLASVTILFTVASWIGRWHR